MLTNFAPKIANLAPFWESFSIIFGIFWPSWAMLGPSWAHLEAPAAHRKRNDEEAKFIDCLYVVEGRRALGGS